MSDITVHLTDGTKKEHFHRGRAGGSYTPRVRYEGVFVIVVDEWENTTAYPAERVAFVETKESGRGW